MKQHMIIIMFSVHNDITHRFPFLGLRPVTVLDLLTDYTPLQHLLLGGLGRLGTRGLLIATFLLPVLHNKTPRSYCYA